MFKAGERPETSRLRGWYLHDTHSLRRPRRSQCQPRVMESLETSFLLSLHSLHADSHPGPPFTSWGLILAPASHQTNAHGGFFTCHLLFPESPSLTISGEGTRKRDSGGGLAGVILWLTHVSSTPGWFEAWPGLQALHVLLGLFTSSLLGQVCVSASLESHTTNARGRKS
jgi:hypothetical protein